jgi:hypothetical protein
VRRRRAGSDLVLGSQASSGWVLRSCLSRRRRSRPADSPASWRPAESRASWSDGQIGGVVSKWVVAAGGIAVLALPPSSPFSTASAAPPSVGRCLRNSVRIHLAVQNFPGSVLATSSLANSIRCMCRRVTRAQLHRSALSYVALHSAGSACVRLSATSTKLVAATPNNFLPALAFPLRGLSSTQGDFF